MCLCLPCLSLNINKFYSLSVPVYPSPFSFSSQVSPLFCSSLALPKNIKVLKSHLFCSSLALRKNIKVLKSHFFCSSLVLCTRTSKLTLSHSTRLTLIKHSIIGLRFISHFTLDCCQNKAYYIAEHQLRDSEILRSDGDNWLMGRSLNTDSQKPFLTGITLLKVMSNEARNWSQINSVHSKNVLWSSALAARNRSRLHCL